MKRKVNYWWERTLVLIGKPLIRFLVHTPVTPNMVTLFNLLIILPAVCIISFNQSYVLLACFVQLYMFLDIVDGNLARNKNMKSELGRKLDIIADTVFYTLGFGIIGIGVEAPLEWILFAILVQQIYGFTATYYIVPQISRADEYKHTRLKQFFMKKDILFGMDASLECLMISVFLLTPFRKMMFVVCPFFWILDLCYRMYELKVVNKKDV